MEIETPRPISRPKQFPAYRVVAGIEHRTMIGRDFS